MTQHEVEKFAATSGRILGVIALVGVVAIVVIGIVDRDHGFPAVVVTGALVFGVLVWAAMLRPRVWATPEALVLRNMLDTVSIPLAAIDTVVVRQVLAVGVGDSRYVSSAIGHSWRQTIKSNRSSERPSATESYPVFVEDRITRLVEDARARHGIKRFTPEQAALADDVRRALAWPEIGVLVGSLVAFVATLVA